MQSIVCRTRLSKHSTGMDLSSGTQPAKHVKQGSDQITQASNKTALGENRAKTLGAAVHAPAGSAFVSKKPTG